ncbi:hypothetical protein EW145_g4777 [Phellinidium pouzarii]|uniref:Uncharacterized protein n=1 Tax=Phellinidium pouzarii TaxID=167371 RepID=A0A4S4L460_9AGAM|nr:hypothetical protein EW145_g4777 [Phellinidium pouzarii]
MVHSILLKKQQKQVSTKTASSSAAAPQTTGQSTCVDSQDESEKSRTEQPVLVEKPFSRKIRLYSSTARAKRVDPNESVILEQTNTEKEHDFSRSEKADRVHLDISSTIGRPWAPTSILPSVASHPSVSGKTIPEGASKKQKKREVIETMNTMIEHLTNTSHEHERKFDRHQKKFEDYQKKLEELPGQFEKIVEKPILHIIEDLRKEVMRLTYENRRLVGVKGELRRVNEELDSIKRHIGLLPALHIPYRRVDDPRGKPFVAWRRDKTRTAYRPPPIDTQLAAACVYKGAPILQQSEVERTAITENLSGQGKEDRREHKRQREEDHPRNDTQTQVKESEDDPCLMRPSSTEELAHLKRVHETSSGDPDLRSPPMKRRNRDGFDYVGLAARGIDDENVKIEDTPSSSKPTSPPSTVDKEENEGC